MSTVKPTLSDTDHSQKPAEGNLSAYSDARKQVADRYSFDSYFIGAISSSVSADEWNRAIETAKFCCGNYAGGRK